MISQPAGIEDTDGYGTELMLPISKKKVTTGTAAGGCGYMDEGMVVSTLFLLHIHALSRQLVPRMHSVHASEILNLNSLRARS